MSHFEEQSDHVTYELKTLLQSLMSVLKIVFNNLKTFLIGYLVVSPSLNIAIPAFSVPGWKYDRMSEMTQRMYVRSFLY